MAEEIRLEEFLEIEKKYNLYEDTIEGINYWVYSRFMIWEDILVKNRMDLGKAHNNKKLKPDDQLRIFVQLLKNSLVNPNRWKRNIDILFIPHPRRVLKKNVYECVYTDEVANYFSNYAALEQPYQWKHLEPMATANLIYGDYLLLKKGLYFALYKYLLRGRYKKLSEEVKRRVSKPLAEIEKRYEFLFDMNQVISCIVMQILFYKGSVKSVRKLLSRLNPKVVVEVVGYNPFCMLINELCKKEKIPVVELQHGRLNNHVAYEYLNEREIKQFPDKLFLFSEFWKKQARVPIEEKDLIVTGYPYFESQIKAAKPVKRYNDGKINILFISQGTIGKKLSGLAYELSHLLDLENYRILYKLHPGEFAIWKKEYPYLPDSGITVIDETGEALYNYFAVSHIQIGVYSTALYEGMGFGLKTLIYQIEMSWHMKDLYEAGYVEYIHDAEEVCEKINEQTSCQEKKNEFWECDAIEKVVFNVKKLL